MRAVFVNHVSPDAPTIGGQRVARLADAVAGLGHQVVLLTETADTDAPGTPLNGLAQILAEHDWATPLHISVKPRPAPYLPKMRTGQIPPGLRHAMIAVSYMLNSGVFTDWTDAARAYVPALRDGFKPEVVWACFGNTDSWNIGRMIAAACKCPWVADFKDGWTHFIPTGFHRILAARYRDAAAMTTLSRAHEDHAAPWFPQPKTVVYSGLDAAFLIPPAGPPVDPPTIMMTGSIYDAGHLRTFLSVLRDWLSSGGRGNVRLAYAGGDGALMRREAAALASRMDIAIDDFLPLAELRRRQQAATVNAYIRAPARGSIFHHKVIELLSAGRPVICYPKDLPEAVEIAAETGAALHSCATVEALAGAFDQTLRGEALTPSAADAFDRFSWQSQGRVLADVLKRAVTDGAP